MSQFLSFEGKDSRKQYWLHTLTFLVGSALLIVLLAKFLSLGLWEIVIAILWFFVWLCVLSTVGVRRCRDVGINLHWVWLWLLPGVGNIFYIVLGCLKSDDGTRIARPPPHKQGIARYLSVFGYATRQEYWCIMIPVSTAINIAITLFITIAFSVFSAIEKVFFAGIVSFFSIAYFTITPCLITAAAVRRCRDAALNPWWATLVLPNLWAGLVVFVLFLAENSKQEMTTEIFIEFLLKDDEFSVKMLLLSLLIITPPLVLGCLTSKEKA